MQPDEYVDFDYGDEPIEPERDEHKKTETTGDHGIGLAIGLAVVLWPIGYLTWIMRSNIGPQLDSDLRWILLRFCDTVLLFCVGTPFCHLFPHPVFQAFSRRLLRGVHRLATIFRWLLVVTFVVAALASFAYLGYELWKLIFQ